MPDKSAEGLSPAGASRRNFLRGAGVAAGSAAAGFLFGRRSAPNPENQQPKPSVTPTAEPANPLPESHSFPGKRPDGSREFSVPFTDAERAILFNDIDVVADCVKTLVDTSVLGKNGVDVDQVAAEMKKWDDEKLANWSLRANMDRIEGDQEQALSLQLGNTEIRAGYIKDRKSGEITYKSVQIDVNADGNYYDGKTPGKPFGIEGLHALPDKLLPLIKQPLGAKPGYSHAKLHWQTGFYLPKDSNMLQENGSLSTEPYDTSDGKVFEIEIWGTPALSSSEKVTVFTVLRQPDAHLITKSVGGEQP